MNLTRRGLFHISLLLLLLFELVSVYLIMPLPGSQKTDSLDVAYFLYTYRWIFRVILVTAMIFGLIRGRWKRKWVPVAQLILAAVVIYFLQFRMSADQMFHPPRTLILKNADGNEVDLSRLVIGIEKGALARAYPIQFLGYHHQVPDTFAGRELLVTYCTVCRSGRVFDPIVDGKKESFRLVGMDHFNAMLEDSSTGSWWRQATGEAVAGPRKGMKLAEIQSSQTSLGNWITMHPGTTIMQPDPAYLDRYDTTRLYETGKSRKNLTGTDSLSWRRKSWVVGISRNEMHRAYDWNTLIRERVLEDTLAGSPVFLVISTDTSSFFAFEKPNPDARVELAEDTILVDGRRYRLDGEGIDTLFTLRKIQAYQEFWHSWEYFHPRGSQFSAPRNSQ